MRIPHTAVRQGLHDEHAYRAPKYAVALAILSAPFAARVAAQAMQRWSPVPFLPPFGAFQGSALPYVILLPAQIAIFATMLAVCWRLRIGALRPRPRIGSWLIVAGGVYVATMLARLTVGLTVPDAPAWFRSDISTIFHFVLALFVLVLAAYHRRAPRRTPEEKCS